MHKYIQLDSTTKCNLNCTFCYKGNSKKDVSQVMPLKKIKELFHKDSEYSGISLVNNGEFFVHPEKKEILEYIFKTVSQNKFCDLISLNTNATLLDTEMSSFILELIKKYKIRFRITFSLNSNCENTYLKLTGKDLFKKAVKNIKDFILITKEFNNIEKLIVCSVQAVVLSENSEELEGFVQRWQDFYIENSLDFEICEDLYHSSKLYIIALRRNIDQDLSGISFFIRKINELQKKFNIKYNNEIETGQDFFKKEPCVYLFDFPASNEEYTTICCRDTYFWHKYKKNEEKDSIKEHYFKFSHILGKFENISLCKNCAGYEKLNSDKVNNYLKENKKENIYPLYKRRLKNGVFFDIYEFDSDNSNSEFLYKNDIISLFSEKDIKNALYKGDFKGNSNKEIDMCIYWIGFLKEKNNKIYSGCSDCNISIEDIENFKNKLKEKNFNSLPEKCILCRNKKSFDPIRDRYRIYGIKGFNRAIIPDKKLQILKSEMLDNISTNINKSIEILHKVNSISFYQNFLGNIISKKIDSKEIYNTIINTKDIFLINEYSIYTEDYFDQVISYKINMDFNIFSQGEKLKILIKYSKLKQNYLHKNIAIDILKDEEQNSILKIKYIASLFENATNSEEIIKLYIKNRSMFYNEDINGSFAFSLKKILKSEQISIEQFLEKYYEINNIEKSTKNILDIFSDMIINKNTTPFFEKIFETKIESLFKSEKYFSIYRFIFHNKEYFQKKDSNFINSILNPDFKDYNFRLIHLFYALSYLFNKDYFLYKIYSFYMKKEEHTKSLLFFNKIQNKNKYWNKQDLKNTELFLLKKNKKIIKYLKNRLIP